MSVLALTSDSVANRYPIDRIWRHHIDWLWCRVMSIRNVCRNRTSVFRIMPSIEMPFLIVLNWLRYQKFKYKVKKKLKVYEFLFLSDKWNYNKADEENFLKSHHVNGSLFKYIYTDLSYRYDSKCYESDEYDIISKDTRSRAITYALLRKLYSSKYWFAYAYLYNILIAGGNFIRRGIYWRRD